MLDATLVNYVRTKQKKESKPNLANEKLSMCTNMYIYIYI